MDKLLGAVLGTDLASFVRKVFATVSPGARAARKPPIASPPFMLRKEGAARGRVPSRGA
jgi:hypothetical protein